MGDRWTHPVCRGCYDRMSGGQEPSRLKGDSEKACCLCGNETSEGIYVRMDPMQTLCKGVHREEKP